MKKFKFHIIQIITYIAVAMYSMHISSCANTRVSPTGGPKDTIPPVVLQKLPDSNSTKFPITKGEIKLTFNEYVQVKDAQSNIVLSPPLSKNIKTKIKGKSIVITFPDSLLPNQTYSINFGSAIVDNNEGNPLSNYSYTFSTGDYIDSLMISGTVVNSESLLPQKGVTVALYRDAKDSTIFKERPIALAKTDEWGYFIVRNLKNVPYSVYAFADNNNNNMYDPGVEEVAFLDSLFTPSKVMKKTSPELATYDIKDTAGFLARPVDINLRIFKEKSQNQFIKDYQRPTKRGAYIKFNAENAQIDSFSIRGIRQDRIIKQFNILKDSLSFWIKDGSTIEDTLFLGIKYLKTDTLGKLVPAVENLKLIAPKEKKESRRERNKAQSKERKDLLKFETKSESSMVEQEGIAFIFSEPLLEARFDTVSFSMSTPKKVKTQEEFTYTQDSLDINKYILKAKKPYVIGNDYLFKIPQGTFKDINGFTNDSSEIKISLPTDDKLSTLTIDAKDVKKRYIVELVNESRSKVFRKYIITQDEKLLFPYLRADKYSIRITEDNNNNGLFDTGDILQKRQPEKVLLYKLEGDNAVIEVKERTDIEQVINFHQLFNNN
jgi:hypothetical protein